MMTTRAIEIDQALPLQIATGDLASDRAISAATARTRILFVAILCQLTTVLLTWSVWNVRVEPVNVPVAELPFGAISFGPLVAASLLLAAVFPRVGVAAHAVVLLVSILFDQYRMQPQFLSLLILMGAGAYRYGPWFARLFLATLWIWAGLHKLLSAEWFGLLSWTLISNSSLPADELHLTYAITVAVAEITLGIMAFVAPRRVPMLCVALHLGIVFQLVVLLKGYNLSVVPWNLATAVIGAWVFRAEIVKPKRSIQYAVAAILLLMPIGFYFDWLNARLAFVLYSGNLPRAYHTKPGELKRLDKWTGLEVPFPDSPRQFVRVFALTASSGEKLFIEDPRCGIPNRYFRMAHNGTVEEITASEFHQAGDGELNGIEVANPGVIWWLEHQGVTVSLGEYKLATGVTLHEGQTTTPILTRLGELPNLRKLTLEGVTLSEQAASQLSQLDYIEELEVRRGQFNPAYLQMTNRWSRLRSLRLEGVTIDSNALAAIRDMRQLQEITVANTAIDETAVEAFSTLADLRSLDLTAAQISDEGIAKLSSLSNCRQLSLAETNISDSAIEHLSRCASLELLNLRRTRISASGFYRLRDALPNCRIEM